MKRLLTIILMTLLIFTNVYAKNDIQVFLETPTMLQAKKGDNLKYSINIKVPKEAKKAYKSFVVTVLIDENLDVKSSSLVGATEKKDSIELKTTKVKNDSQSLITLAVMNIDSIGNTELIKIPLDCVLKSDIGKVDGLKNSVILTSVGMDGSENTDQQSFVAQTPSTQATLSVNPIKEGDANANGKANPKAKISATLNGKSIGEVVADDNGSFTMKLPTITAAQNIIFKSTYTVSGKEQNAEVVIVVEKSNVVTDKKEENPQSKPKEEDKKPETVVNKEENNKPSISTREELQDYLNLAETLNTRGLSMEGLLKFQAALATGKYIEIKASATPEEIGKATNDLKEVIKELRKPYMTGTQKDTFKVESYMTRGQGAFIFANIINGEAPTSIYSSFKDVPQRMWYAEAIGFCEKNGVISGYDDKTFKPEKQLKRAEFAMIVYRYLGYNENYTKQTFSDVKPGYYAFDAINTLKENGILTGSLDGKFHPEAKIKRGEAATIINRALRRKPNVEFLNKYGKNPFKDLKKKHWAYYEILEATGN